MLYLEKKLLNVWLIDFYGFHVSKSCQQNRRVQQQILSLLNDPLNLKIASKMFVVEKKG